MSFELWVIIKLSPATVWLLFGVFVLRSYSCVNIRIYPHTWLVLHDMYPICLVILIIYPYSAPQLFSSSYNICVFVYSSIAPRED